MSPRDKSSEQIKVLSLYCRGQEEDKLVKYGNIWCASWWWGWWWKGGWEVLGHRLVREGLSKDVIFEQVREGGEGRGHVTLWGRVRWVAEDPCKIQEVGERLLCSRTSVEAGWLGKREEEEGRGQRGQETECEAGWGAGRMWSIGELSEGFEQRSNVTWLTFWKPSSAAGAQTDSSGAGQGKWPKWRGHCNKPGDRWQCLGPGCWW